MRQELLDLRKALLATSPLWLAGALHAQLNATDLASLRAHITTVNGTTTNDTINVAAGTYTLTGAPDGATPNVNSGDLDITKAGGNLTIQGAGVSTTFIDGNLLDRVFHIAATTGGTITIRDLTIRDGRAVDDGSAAVNPGEARGGGIYNETGTNLTLDRVTFESNAAQGVNATTLGVGFAGGNALGGGLYSAGGTLSIDASLFDSSVAVGGGGVAGTLSTPATPGGNALGGALYVAGGTVSIAATSITIGGANAGNGGNGYNGFNGLQGGAGGIAQGGAIYALAGGLNLSACTLDGNTAAGGNGGQGGFAGAGYYNGGSGGQGGNGGDSQGGAIYAISTTVMIQNSTISGNVAQAGDGANGRDGGSASAFMGVGGGGGDGGNGGSGSGGGVYAASGAISIQNCTVASNSTGAGAAGFGGTGGVGFFPGPAGPGGMTGTDSGGGFFEPGAATAALASTIFADNSSTANPDFDGAASASACLIEDDTGASVTGTYITGNPGLAPLGSNGGPTRTHAILQTSIAFNAGSNPGALTTDQRGTGFNRVRDGTADIGAFEVQTGSGGGTTGGGNGKGNGGGCSTDGTPGLWAWLVALLAWLGLVFRRRHADSAGGSRNRQGVD